MLVGTTFMISQVKFNLILPNKRFDRQTVLADAIQTFWRNGYADTSMEVIVSQTGVSRYGLYGTFGNEKELLIAAIRHYN